MNPHETLDGQVRMRSSRLSLPPPPALLSELYWARDFLTRLPLPTAKPELGTNPFCGLNPPNDEPLCWTSHVLCWLLLRLNAMSGCQLLDLPWQIVTGYFPSAGYYHSWFTLQADAVPGIDTPWILDLAPPGAYGSPQLYSACPPPHWATDLETGEHLLRPRDRKIIAAEVEVCLMALAPNGRRS